MHQVYEKEAEAEAARVPPQWSQLLRIIIDATKRPLLWFFTAVSLLHGEWGSTHSSKLLQRHVHVRPHSFKSHFYKRTNSSVLTSWRIWLPCA